MRLIWEILSSMRLLMNPGDLGAMLGDLIGGYGIRTVFPSLTQGVEGILKRGSAGTKSLLLLNQGKLNWLESLA